MAAKKRKKPAFVKLYINGLRKGVLQYWTAYTAPEAARKAAEMARQGWQIDVKAAHSDHLKMRCTPAVKRGRTIAVCDIKPAFKKQIKGR